MLPQFFNTKIIKNCALICALSVFTPAQAIAKGDLSNDGIYAVARLATLQFKSSDQNRAKILNSTLEQYNKHKQFTHLSETEFVEKANELYKEIDVSEFDFLKSVFNNTGDKYTRVYKYEKGKAIQSHKTKKIKDGYQIDVGTIVIGNCNILTPKGSYSTVKVDLRGNAGGHIECAESILERLLSVGVHSYKIVTNTGTSLRVIEGKRDPKVTDLYVSIDNETASSAELMMWLLEEDGYKISGGKSFGKNLIQSYYGADYYNYAVTVGEFETAKCDDQNGCDHGIINAYNQLLQPL